MAVRARYNLVAVEYGMWFGYRSTQHAGNGLFVDTLLYVVVFAKSLYDIAWLKICIATGGESS